ncbi:MAG: restriction endonuclease subunit S [Thermodesulfobacteriota bacterium]
MMMTGAQRMPLGDAVRFGNGKAIKPGGYGQYPVYGSNGIIGGCDAFRHENGVIIGRVGAYCGSVAYCPGKFWASDNTLVAYPASEQVDTRFLFYLLTDAQLSRYAGGAAQPLVTQTVLRGVEVRVPPLSAQRRIAGILSAYDDLIENNQRRIRILEEMARALYREWFVRFRFPGHEAVPLVDSPLGPIPEGWKVKRFGEIAESVRRNVSKGQLEEPRPYVGLEHIPRRSLALDAWEMTTDLGSNKLEFKKGEVLFGKIRPYFHKVSIAHFDGLCSADTIVLRSQRPEYDGLVAAVASSDDFVAHATATSNGSKMPRASWEVLANYPVVMPDGAFLKRFSDLFIAATTQQQALVRQAQNLRRTRDLLLPQLLSGRLTVAAD